MPTNSPLRYSDGQLIQLQDRAQALLPDGRLVVGRVIRLKARERRVKLAFHDPHFRRRDGQRCSIRRLCLARKDLSKAA